MVSGRRQEGEGMDNVAGSFRRAAAVSGLMIGYTAGVGQRGETQPRRLLFIKPRLSLSFALTHTSTFNLANVAHIPRPICSACHKV